MPTARKTRRLLVAGLMVALGAMAVWPRGVRLVRFTSPVVDCTIGKARFEGTVPAGWEARVFRESPAILDVIPEPAWNWLPHPIRRLLTTDDSESYVAVVTYIAELDGPCEDSALHVMERTPDNSKTWFAYKRIGDTALFVRYHHARRDVFEATYQQICESFRVARRGE